MRNGVSRQHSDRGNIDGINEKVDFNVFNGDSSGSEEIVCTLMFFVRAFTGRNQKRVGKQALKS
jgi:hypothetical protein